jgi:sugar phosphate isomerase/epimerase
MKLHVGVKSDPIENRCTYDWLFGLMAEHGIHHFQLGSFFAMYELDDEWFLSLARRAEKKGIRINSLFTSHRELGGCMTGDPLMEAATRRSWERLIRVASLSGASSAGSNAGSVMRDRPEYREAGIQGWFRLMKSLTRIARAQGLEALTVEPMSSAFEFPSTAQEIRRMDRESDAWRAADTGVAAPLYYCADISHGLADASGQVIADNWELFEQEIPHMWEFHFKNTDAIFNATFGFSPAERERGIVDLRRLKLLIEKNAERFPGRELIGYLEHPGPKVGRDYTDNKLHAMLSESLEALVSVFGGA